MIDDRLDDLFRERARSADVDWGNAWLGRVAGEVVAYPRQAAVQLGVRALEVAGRAVVSTLIEPLRRTPAHASEMVSEIRSGEPILLLHRERDWWLIAGEDEYVGWLHDWVVQPLEDEQWTQWRARHGGSYARPLGTLWISDHHAGTPLVLGSPLLRVQAPVTERGDWLLVATTTGAEGWILRAEMRSFEAAEGSRLALRCAHMLLGTPYRWGGRSPLGFDCSGFVQFVLQLAGVRLPRDAAQQQHVGDAVDLDPAAWSAGDLLCFGERADHVGIYDGRRGMIHCRGGVRRDELGNLTTLLARLHTVRRPRFETPAAANSLWSFVTTDRH